MWENLFAFWLCSACFFLRLHQEDLISHGDYKFMLWAGDGDPDTFRIKIWKEDQVTGAETDVYDTGFDQEIGGGEAS